MRFMNCHERREHQSCREATGFQTSVAAGSQRGSRLGIPGRGKVFRFQRREEKWGWGSGSRKEAEENRWVCDGRIEIKGELKMKTENLRAKRLTQGQQLQPLMTSIHRTGVTEGSTRG